jgi:prevent-host-death family protein
MPDTTSSVRELRDTLADVIDRASHDEVTIVTRRGREVAAVVPIEMVTEYRRWEEERVAALIDERMAVSDGTGASLAEVMAETLARPE